VPEVEAVNVEVQVATAVVPARVQVVKVPVTPVSLRATVPVGVMKVPAETSVTVTVQVEAWLITTGVVQLTAVVVARGFTTILAVPLLVEWDVSPGYDAVTAAVPEVEAVKVELQVAAAVVPARVQVVKVPVTPVSDNPTVPVGVMKVPREVSVTVTVHVDAWLMTTGLVQLTAVVVVRNVTVMLVVPLDEA
jgi:hypothetical protein